MSVRAQIIKLKAVRSTLDPEPIGLGEEAIWYPLADFEVWYTWQSQHA